MCQTIPTGVMQNLLKKKKLYKDLVIRKMLPCPQMMLLLAVAVASHLSTQDEDHQRGHRRWIFRWLSSTRDSPKSHPQSSGADDVELSSFAVRRKAEWVAMVALLEELCCKCSDSVSRTEVWADETERHSEWTMRPKRNFLLHFLDNWALASSGRNLGTFEGPKNTLNAFRQFDDYRWKQAE